jgi:hypothetical protein
MTAARAKRVARLEDAAVLRVAREVAAEYGLTDEEAEEMERDTRRALARWRAGLPVDLAWLLDEAAADLGLGPAERAELEADLRAHRAEHAAGGLR